MRVFARDTRAAAGAEMVLVLPLLAVLFINVADASRYIYTRMQVDLAAQEAVGAARMVCDTEAELPATTNCGGLDGTMLTAAQSTSLGGDVTLGAASEAWYCSDATAELVQVAAIADTPPADCSGTIAGSTATPGEYISVEASAAFTSLFPGTSVAALLPETIARTAWMRLQ